MAKIPSLLRARSRRNTTPTRLRLEPCGRLLKSLCIGFSAVAGAVFPVAGIGFPGDPVTAVSGVLDNDIINNGLTYASSSSQAFGAGAAAAAAGDGLIGNAAENNGLMFDDADGSQRLSIAGFNSSITTIRIFTEHQTVPDRLIQSLTVHYKAAAGTSLVVGDYDDVAGSFPDFQSLGFIPIATAVTGRANLRYYTFSVSAPAGTQAILLDFGDALGAGDFISEVQAWPQGAGLPFTENFSTTALGSANAEWDTSLSLLHLKQAERTFGAFRPSSSPVFRENISSDDHETFALAVGDLDADTYPDVVAANRNQINRVYFNNEAGQFLDQYGYDIGAEIEDSRAAALGDLNGDGNLDLVIGNYSRQVNRIYLHNGKNSHFTLNPFDGAPSNLGAEADNTLAVAIADLNGDGFPDIIVGNDNQPNLLYLNQGGAAPFDGVTPTPISSDVAGTTSIAVGDLNHDGFPDVVAGNRNSPNTLYLNNGTSDPFAGVSAIEITGDSDLTEGVALADFNGDGFLDVYAANNFQLNRVYFNNGTANPFTGVFGQNAGEATLSSTAVAAGDVDNDGMFDVAVANSSHETQYHRNNGGLAPFMNTEALDLNAMAFGSSDVKFADLDQDGALDVLMANRDTANEVYLNIVNTERAVFFNVEPTKVTTATFDTRDMAAGDVDNDGDIDLVIAHTLTGMTDPPNHVLLNNGTPNPFNGVTPADITTDADRTDAIVLGDINGDGNLDVVAGNTGMAEPIRRYLGTGAGTFSAGANVTAESNPVTALALGDLDGDGSLDLVAGIDSGSVENRVYLNTGSPTAPFPTAGAGAAVGAVAATRAVALADLNKDGKLDLIEGIRGARNQIHLGVGDGTFSSSSDIGTETDATEGVAVADIDGDGNLDVLVANDGQKDRLYRGNGDGSFAAAEDISSSAGPSFALKVADFNRDGRLDVVVARNGFNSVAYMNDGVSPFFDSPGNSSIMASSAYAVAVADFTGDGVVDIALGDDAQEDVLVVNPFGPVPFNPIDATDVQTGGGQNNGMLVADVNGDKLPDAVRLVNNALIGNLNNGNAFPNDPLDADVTLRTLSLTPTSLALGDIDDDGILDVAFGGFGTPQIALGSGNPATPFSSAPQNIGAGFRTGSDIVLADLSGDGFLDAILSQNGGGTFATNLVFTNNQTATPFAGVTANILGTNRETTLALVAADFDGDGLVDVVVGNQNEVNRYHRNGGGGAMGNGSLFSSRTDDTRDLLAGDVNRDGRLDLVVINHGEYNLLYTNNGSANPFNGVVPILITEDTDDSTRGHLVDIDLDADLDLVVGNDAGQPSKIYINDGALDIIEGPFGPILSLGNPFDGIGTGIPVSTDNLEVTGIGSGDLDRNVTIDLLIAGRNGSRHYFRPEPLRFNHAPNLAWSGNVNQTATPVEIIRITPTATLPPNTSIDYLASNNGGDEYVNVIPGRPFVFPPATFPDPLTDLRWRVRLNSSSGALTPLLDSLLIERIPANGTPVIMDQMFALDENTGNGTIFATVIATDPDILNTLTYTILTPGTPFAIDPATGELSVSDQAALDYETVPGMQFVFTVQVLDDGTVPQAESATATITVTLNDLPEPPDVTDQAFSIPENSPDTTLIGTIAASDPDTGDSLTFTVLSGDPQGILSVGMANGEIRVNDSSKLDYEQVTGLTLSVQVSDTGAAPAPPVNAVTVTVTVGIINVDDPPLISAQMLSVTEAARDGHVVGTVAASEPDAGQTLKYRIVSGNDSNIFAINEDTGEITVAPGGMPDHETAPTHMLMVETYGVGPIGPAFSAVSPASVGSSLFTDVTVKLHDLDGDGKPDAILAGNLNGGLGGEINSILLNNGTTDPFNAVAGTPISMDSHDTRAIAIGDVDGVNGPDIVVANFGQANRLYLNNGAGPGMDPFNGVSGTDISPDIRDSLSIALIDVNGDGRLDVLVGNGSAEGINLYFNDGAGDPFDNAIPYYIASGFRDIAAFAIGTLDLNPRPDFAIAVDGGGSLGNYMFLNDGGTSAPFPGPNMRFIGTEFDVSADVAIADLNADNRLDLIFANRGALNRFHLGDGTVQPFNGIAGTDLAGSPSDSEAVAIGDIDNDGDLDIVFAEGQGSSTSVFYENTGLFAPFNGVLPRPLNAAFPADSRSLALGDVDGDGDLDILLGNTGAPAQLYLNDRMSLLTNSAIITIDLEEANDAPTVADQAFDVNENTPNGMSVGFVAFGDDDLAKMPPDTHTFAFTGGDTGAFEINPTTGEITVKDVAQLNAEGPTTSYELTVQVTDNGGGSLFVPRLASDLTSDANDTQAIALHDMNDDSLLDVVTGNYLQHNLIVVNNGTASPFMGVLPVQVSGDLNTTRSLAIADFDARNGPDVIFGNDSGRNRIVLNTGALVPFDGANGGNLGNETLTTLAVAAADLNGDGLADAFIGDSFGNNRFHPNKGGNEPFVGVSPFFVEMDGLDTRAVALADMDGDGHVDVIEGSDSATPRLFRNDGSMGGNPFEMVSPDAIGIFPLRTRALAVGDVNGDLAPDLVVATADNAGGQINMLFLNNNAGPGADPFFGVPGTPIGADINESYAIALADLDQDGRLDLVVGNWGTAGAGEVNRIYLNTGMAPYFTVGVDLTSDSHATTGIAVGDVNGDGQTDIVVGNQNQRNRLYLNNRLSDTAVVTVTVKDINDPPTATAQNFMIDENSMNGSPVTTPSMGPGVVQASDEDMNNFSFAFNPQNAAEMLTDNAFQIDPMTGAITVKDMALLDHETTPQFTVTVDITDDGMNPAPETTSILVTIDLNNLNEAPALAAAQMFDVDENTENGTPVGTVAFSDDDLANMPADTHTFAFTADDTGAFEIDGMTGEIRVKDVAQLDAEAPTTVFTPTVTVTDSGDGNLSDSKQITITVKNVNEPPAIPAGQTFSIAETAMMNAPVGMVTANQVEGGEIYTYALVGVTPFAIDPMSGAITVATPGSLDYEPLAPNFFFNVTVMVSDNGTPSANAMSVIRIDVTNVNEAPDLDPAQSFTIPENLADGMPVGTLTFTEPDLMDTLVFSITSPAFAIDGSGNITVADSSLLDFEMTPVFMETVTVTDLNGSGFSDMESVTITLMDQNDPPTVTLPSPVVLLEDQTTVISGISVSDVENGMAPLLIDLSVAHGSLVLTSTANLMLIDNDGSDGTLQFSGSQADITAALASSVEYTPTPDYNTADQLTVTADDQDDAGPGGRAQTTVQLDISVTPVNDKPSFAAVNPDAILEDTLAVRIIAGWAAFNSGPVDENSQAVVSYLVSDVSNTGIFSQLPTVNAAGDLSYQVAADAHGSSTFTVRVKDDGGVDFGGQDTSDPRIFTILVTPVNDSPSFTAANPPTVLEGSGAQSVSGWVSASDPGNAFESIQTIVGYSVSNISEPAFFTVPPTVSVGGNLTYTLASDASGAVTFDVVAQDSGDNSNGGSNLSAPQTYTLTVTDINDQPSFSVAPTTLPATLEDAGSVTIMNWATLDPGNAFESAQVVDRYEVSVTAGAALFQTPPAIDASGTLTYTPADDANGAATISVTVTDNGGADNAGVETSAAQTFSIIVTAVNDAPSFTASVPTPVNEDGGAVTQAGWVTAFTPGPDNESSQTVAGGGYAVSVISNPSLFAVPPAVADNGDLSFTIAEGANGVATFGVTVRDNGGSDDGGSDTSPQQVFTLAVNGVNDKPSIAASDPPAILEDAGPQAIANWAAFDAGAPGEAGQMVQDYLISGVDNAFFAVAPDVDNDGRLTYTVADDANGTTTFSVAVQDNGGTDNGGIDTSDALTVTITVAAVNDRPSFVASNPPVINEDAGPQTVTGWVTKFDAGPADEEAAQTPVYVVENISNETFFTALPSVSPAGDLTYATGQDVNGSATFQVKVMDDGGTDNSGEDESALQTFTIVVNPVNDRPTLSLNDPGDFMEDSGQQAIPGFAEFDPGSESEAGQAVDAFLITGVTNPAMFSEGPTVLNDGTLVFTPAANANGTVAFNVAVRDNGGGDDTSPALPATLVINAVNDAPEISVPPATPTGPEDQALTITGVSINDVDSGADSLLVNLSIRNGSLSLNLAGGIAFNDFDGSDGTLEFFGSEAALAAAFQSGVNFTPVHDFHGELVLTIAVDDLGNSGEGGPLTASEDLIVAITSVNDPPSLPNDSFSLAENSPTGAIAGEAVGSDPESQPFNGIGATPLGDDALDTRQVVVIDVNGDTFPDVVTAKPGAANRLHLNSGGVDPFGRSTGIALGGASDTRAVAVADIDGDLRPDVVFGNHGEPNQFLINNGTDNPFQGVPVIDVASDARNTRALALADFTGDGRPDLVVGNGGGQKNYLYVNNGTPSPFAGVIGTQVANDAHNTESLAFGDLDGDGDLDLVAGNSGAQRNRIYLNNGTSQPFLGVAGIDLTADAQDTRAVALADVNGDEKPDVIVANFGQPNRLYLNNGTTQPFNGVAGVNVSSDADNSTSIAVADVDGDMDNDLLFGNHSQPDRIFLNNGGDALFSESGFNVNPLASSTRSVAFGFLNGDAHPDIVTGNDQGESDRVIISGGETDNLTYAIVGGNTRNAFAIDAQTGVISVLTPDSVDFETTPVFNLQVAVTDDGVGNLSALATIAINLTNVNEPPAIDAPASVGGPEDLALSIADISVADPDAGEEPVFVNLAVLMGSLSLGDVTGLTLTDGDGSDGSLAFHAPQSALNAAFAAGVVYHPSADFNGMDILAIQTADQGQSGTGGPLTDNRDVTINITSENDPPTTVGIPDVLVTENSLGSVIDLFAAFADVEDEDPQLTYTVLANTNPSLFQSTPIDAMGGTLTLNYAVDATGISLVTVRVTDTGSAAVETTFRVTVRELQQSRSEADAPGQADWLGYSVDIHGDLMVAGAWRDDDVGADSGSVQIFHREPGRDDDWKWEATLHAAGGAADDAFGRAVAIQGDTIIVGTDGDNSAAGAAYVFQRDHGGPRNWGLVAKLTAADASPGSRFGWSVALNGDTAVVGAYHDDASGRKDAGAAYLFERNQNGPNAWGQTRKLVAPDGAAEDLFGAAVAISGDLVLVGAPTDSHGGIRSGSAYLFSRNQDGSNQWGQLKKLLSGSPAADDWFGWSVDISGGIAVVGAYRADDRAADSGSATIFDRNEGGPGNWGLAKQLTPADAEQGDFFGHSVTIDGDNAIVGAHRNDDAGSSSGSAYQFSRHQNGPNAWGQVAKLLATDASQNQQFGFAVSSDRNSIAVGAPTTTTTVTEAGAVYTFRIGSPIEDYRMANFSIEDLADPAKESTIWGDNADPDGDGDSNFFEFVAGLDPTSAAEGANFTFTQSLVPGQPPLWKITFGPIVEGRTYEVQFTDGFGSNNYMPLTGGIIENEGNMRSHTDTSPTGLRFYRVQVSLP